MISKEYSAEEIYKNNSDKRHCIEGIRSRMAENLSKAIAKQKRLVKKEKISNIKSRRK